MNNDAGVMEKRDRVAVRDRCCAREVHGVGILISEEGWIGLGIFCLGALRLVSYVRELMGTWFFPPW